MVGQVNEKDSRGAALFFDLRSQQASRGIGEGVVAEGPLQRTRDILDRTWHADNGQASIATVQRDV